MSMASCIATGRRHLARVTTLLEDESVGLPTLIREECRDLLAHIAKTAARGAERTTTLKMLACARLGSADVVVLADRFGESPRAMVGIGAVAPFEAGDAF